MAVLGAVKAAGCRSEATKKQGCTDHSAINNIGNSGPRTHSANKPRKHYMQKHYTA